MLVLSGVTLGRGVGGVECWGSAGRRGMRGAGLECWARRVECWD